MMARMNVAEFPSMKASSADRKRLSRLNRLQKFAIGSDVCVDMSGLYSTKQLNRLDMNVLALIRNSVIEATITSVRYGMLILRVLGFESLSIRFSERQSEDLVHFGIPSGYFCYSRELLEQWKTSTNTTDSGNSRLLGCFLRKSPRVVISDETVTDLIDGFREEETMISSGSESPKRSRVSHCNTGHKVSLRIHQFFPPTRLNKIPSEFFELTHCLIEGTVSASMDDFCDIEIIPLKTTLRLKSKVLARSCLCCQDAVAASPLMISFTAAALTALKTSSNPKELLLVHNLTNLLHMSPKCVDYGFSKTMTVISPDFNEAEAAACERVDSVNNLVSMDRIENEFTDILHNIRNLCQLVKKDSKITPDDFQRKLLTVAKSVNALKTIVTDGSDIVCDETSWNSVLSSLSEGSSDSDTSVHAQVTQQLVAPTDNTTTEKDYEGEEEGEEDEFLSDEDLDFLMDTYALPTMSVAQATVDVAKEQVTAAVDNDDDEDDDGNDVECTADWNTAKRAKHI